MRNPASEKSKARKAAFLDLVAGGRTLVEARAEMHPPLKRTTYLGWRRDDPDFRRKVDDLVGRTRGSEADADGTGGSDDGTFVGRRKRYFGFDTYHHQREIVRAIETCPPMGVTLVLLPPEHGKTTTIHDYLSDRIGHDKNVRVTYVSAGQGLSRKAVGRIKRRLTDVNAFSAFIGAFGPFHDEGRDDRPWTADYFTVLGANHDEQDYTMEARGWTASIAGTRCDLMIVDDIQSRKNLSQTAAMVETFRQDWITRVGRNGAIIIIGTRVEEDDFYARIIDEGLVDRLVLLPAVDDTAEPEPCPLGDDCEVAHIPHLPPLCPEMWDAHALAKRRAQVGEAAWARNYQQKPTARGESTFTEAMTERAKNVVRLLGVSELVPPHRILTVDPALGGGNVVEAWGMDAERLALIDLRRDFGFSQYEQIYSVIETFALNVRPHAVVVEAVSFQKGLANDDRLTRLAHRYGFQVVPHMTDANKIDEMVGVAAMDAAFLCGAVDFPWGDEAAQAKVQLLIEELHKWRPNIPTRKLRQDLVMAMWFAWLYWHRIRTSLGADPEARAAQWRRAGLARPTALPSLFSRSA